MIRFYLALWACKMAMWIFKIRGIKDDRPGVLAFKICPDYLKRIAKPELVITVSGTNGKTTTSTLINNMLVARGKKVSFNEGGANVHAGFCLNLTRGVTVFNHCRIDASVLEADEKTLGYTMGMIKPHYIVVTNICKDSLRRNGHTEYIFNCMRKAFVNLGSETTAVLNANDPISSRLADGTGAKIVYYGASDMHTEPYDNIVKDIILCPHCAEEFVYDYRIYRHLGGYHCPHCGWQMPKADFFAENVDLENRTVGVREKNGVMTYPLISDTVFNAFNVLSTIALFRTIGYQPEVVSDFLSTQKVTKIREDFVSYRGVDYYIYGGKGQNSSAVSTVFEFLVKEPRNKVLVFCFDELQDRNHPPETVSWLYEADYEFLNSPNIRQIVVAGHMYLNHRLRLLLAGIPEEKIVAVEDEALIPKLVNTENAESLYVLFEVDNVEKAFAWRDAIVAYAKSENEEVAS